MSGLYVVATPIGNLADITSRAVTILGSVDAILAEDTRHTGVLLAHLGIHKPVHAYHDHNKEKVTSSLVRRLTDGESLALVSDAGTPGIADPAFYLVRAAIEAGVAVVPVPGPTAAIAALVASGLPTDRFVFENYLPPKQVRRRKALEALRDERRTIVIYETPHRILATLADMAEVLGEVHVAIGRELTKTHEEFLRGTPLELIAHFSDHAPRGEMVVVLNTRHGPNRHERLELLDR